MTTSESDRILVMGATNRPEDIDEAALRFQHCMILNVHLTKLMLGKHNNYLYILYRRFTKKIYIPLPDSKVM